MINREFGHFDIFPTILDSLGVNIKNNRLGLGVDLVSKEKTLLENKEDFDLKDLSKKSKIYENFLYQKANNY